MTDEQAEATAATAAAAAAATTATTTTTTTTAAAEDAASDDNGAFATPLTSNARDSADDDDAGSSSAVSTSSSPSSSSGDSQEVEALLHGAAPPTEEEAFLAAHREELVRLGVQLLQGLGCPASARLVQKESGVRVESARSYRLKRSILRGDWAAAARAVAFLRSAGALASPGAADAVLLSCAKQRYLEQLAAGDRGGALATLRGEVTPHCPCPKEVHRLALLLVGTGGSLPGWPGEQAGRAEIVRGLHRHVSEREVVQDNRLAHLLLQSQEWQRARCSFLNDGGGRHTLLRDYADDGTSLPSHPTYTLRTHSDEVWTLAFSHDGTLLASGSRSGRIVVHDVSAPTSFLSAQQPPSGRRGGGGGGGGGGAAAPSTVNPPIRHLHTFSTHTLGVTALAFSPDGASLLSSSADRTVKLWKLDRRSSPGCSSGDEGAGAGSGGGGAAAKTFRMHTEEVSAVRWHPDGKHFFSAAVDYKTYMVHAETGAVVKGWHTSRVLDLCVTPDGSELVSVDSEKRIICYDLTVPFPGLLHLRSRPPPPPSPSDPAENPHWSADLAGGGGGGSGAAAADASTTVFRRSLINLQNEAAAAAAAAAQQQQGSSAAEAGAAAVGATASAASTAEVRHSSRLLIRVPWDTQPQEWQPLLQHNGSGGGASAATASPSGGDPALQPRSSSSAASSQQQQQQQPQPPRLSRLLATHLATAAAAAAAAAASAPAAAAAVEAVASVAPAGGAAATLLHGAQESAPTPAQQHAQQPEEAAPASADEEGGGTAAVFSSLYYNYVLAGSPAHRALRGSAPHANGFGGGVEAAAASASQPLRDPVKWALEEKDALTCCEVSTCGGYLLCGVAVKESRGRVQLYALKGGRQRGGGQQQQQQQPRRVQSYVGARQTKYVVRPGFGGVEQHFVVSGSEDGKVVVFNRRTGQQLATLSAHLRVTNAVVWNPAYPQMLASCSDDATIVLWSTLPPDRVEVAACARATEAAASDPTEDAHDEQIVLCSDEEEEAHEEYEEEGAEEEGEDEMEADD